MAKPGDFTVSGILYEGSDYSAWRSRVEAMLRLHLGIDDQCDLSKHFWRKSTEKRAAAKVRAFVSDELLDRAPHEFRDKPLQLIDALEARAKPFRLMELPSELRVRVCEKAIGRERSHCIWCPQDEEEDEELTRRDRFAPLVHASSKLRHEALPIYYSLRILDISLRVNADSTLAGFHEFETWMFTIARRQRRAMRRLCIWLGSADPWPWGAQIEMVVEFSEQKGLHLTVLNDAPSGFRQKLEAMLVATETYRKAMGWKGEALALVVTGQPELWEEAWSTDV